MALAFLGALGVNLYAQAMASQAKHFDYSTYPRQGGGPLALSGPPAGVVLVGCVMLFAILVWLCRSVGRRNG